MKKERYWPVLGTWLKDTVTAPPDPRQTARKVAERIPETPQIRRRWWLPSLRRTPTPPHSNNQPTDYQLTPIPATKGHSPTVLGRTQSMLSPVKAITAGALIFALGGVMLIAQPFDQQGGSVPGAATEVEQAAPVEFTASWGFGGANLQGGVPEGTNPTRILDGVWAMRIIEPASDPRFVGDVNTANNRDDYSSTGALQVYSRAFSVENDEGSWRGVPHSFVIFPTGATSGATQVFIGERGYLGSYAVADITTVAGPAGGVELRGLIFEGTPPPLPGPFVSE